MRIGNCTELAVVAANYLWRFPGKEIKQIELVKAIDFDHVWLILNRKKRSEKCRKKPTDKRSEEKNAKKLMIRKK